MRRGLVSSQREQVNLAILISFSDIDVSWLMQQRSFVVVGCVKSVVRLQEM